ncbi:MAG TPA: hypothetical protein DDY49_06445, partial [Paenibacillaceae bacterium]|nr:hypothetical protein [Paenibacillaceae bacterium]
MKPVVKIFITFIPLILILLLVPTSNSSAYTRFHGKYTQTPYNTYYWNGVDQIPTINAPLYVDNAMSMWNNTSNTRIWMVKTTNQSASILDFHSKVLEDINILGRTTWWVG